MNFSGAGLGRRTAPGHRCARHRSECDDRSPHVEFSHVLVISFRQAYRYTENQQIKITTSRWEILNNPERNINCCWSIGPTNHNPITCLRVFGHDRRSWSCAWAGSRLSTVTKRSTTAMLVALYLLASITKPVVRSTSVPTDVRLPAPLIRSPS